MRIAIVGASGFDTIEYNFWETFIHLGHESKIFDDKEILKVFGKRSRRVVSVVSGISYGFAIWAYNKLARKVVSYEPDLVLVTYRNVIPEFIRNIKSNLKNVSVIHVNPDHVGTLGRQYILSSPYDAYFTKEPFWAKTMKYKLGLNVFYLPESFNPRLHAKPACSKKECEEKTDVDIVIASGMYIYRNIFLETLFKLLPDNLKIRIHGSKYPWAPTELWKYHSNKPVYGKEKAEAFYGAKIVLNNMHYSEYEGVNCRFFEVLGSGGFQICDDKAALPELAVPDKEVVTFKTLQEAADKIRYYLSCPEKRWAIAEAGYKRALCEHTYEKRIETILSVINCR